MCKDAFFVAYEAYTALSEAACYYKAIKFV